MIGVLVDLDGVLWFSQKLHKDAFIKAFKEFTGEAEELVNQTWEFGESTHQYARKLLSEIGIENQEVILKEFIAKKRMFAFQTDVIPLNTRLIETLTMLRSINLKIALVSSSSRLNVNKFISVSKTKDLFDCIVDSSMVLSPKPSPDCYNYAMAKLELVPNKCIAIEDSDIGMQSARNANIKIVLKFAGIAEDSKFYISLNSSILKINHDH
jgi:HAD superfamily hydrolase (TIGR01509 family)